MNIGRKITSPAIALAFSLLTVANAFGQAKNFTPVEGPTLKARIENGMAGSRKPERTFRVFLGLKLGWA